jgi:hypothetical protein
LLCLQRTVGYEVIILLTCSAVDIIDMPVLIWDVLDRKIRADPHVGQNIPQGPIPDHSALAKGMVLGPFALVRAPNPGSDIFDDLITTGMILEAVRSLGSSPDDDGAGLHELFYFFKDGGRYVRPVGKDHEAIAQSVGKDDPSVVHPHPVHEDLFVDIIVVISQPEGFDLDRPGFSAMQAFRSLIGDWPDGRIDTP